VASLALHVLAGARAALRQKADPIGGAIFGGILDAAVHSPFASSLPGGTALSLAYTKLALDSVFEPAPEKKEDIPWSQTVDGVEYELYEWQPGLWSYRRKDGYEPPPAEPPAPRPEAIVETKRPLSPEIWKLIGK